jgi:hypothetical protein
MLSQTYLLSSSLSKVDLGVEGIGNEMGGPCNGYFEHSSVIENQE